MERSYEEFVDALQTADDELAFERIARRVTERIGFRWFAYLYLTGDTRALVSSYPKFWTRRYFDVGYERVDPIIQHASRINDVFVWDRRSPRISRTREQRLFFDEATSFGIMSGTTVPIKCGFGRVAAFTLATDEGLASTDRLVANARDVLQLIGIYFHTHVAARLHMKSKAGARSILTQRERQCLAWVAQGKTAAEIALLVGISPRTVMFHLENARGKLNASSVAHCVAEALRRDLLS